MIFVIVSPAGLAVSSSTAVRVASEEKAGASFTAVTVIVAESDAEEKAVSVPLVCTSTLLPCWPLLTPVWSQA